MSTETDDVNNDPVEGLLNNTGKSFLWKKWLEREGTAFLSLVFRN